MKISDIILQKIKDIHSRKPLQKFNWDDSLYEDIQFLSIDERGQLGEEITVDILRSFGCSIEYDSSLTEEMKGWDLISNNLKIEVKLATVTIGTGMFQHEHLDSKRDFHAVLFIDVTPEEIYLTAVCRKDIIWEKLHKREYGTSVYKCDFTIKQIQNVDIPKFNKYNTGLVSSTQDFFNIYKWIEENCNK